MFKWCSYCQKFMTEVPPKDSYEVTHGACAACFAKTPAERDSEIEKIHVIRDFQNKLWQAGRRGDIKDAELLIQEGLTRSLRPLDILLGIITPSLYRVGNLWEKGQMTVIEEHKFTAYCHTILEILDSKIEPLKSDDPHSILLTCSTNNTHILGVRILELALREAGLAATTIFPGVPQQELVNYVDQKKPRVLGISVAQQEDFPEVKAIALRISKLKNPPTIFVGGFGIKSSSALSDPNLRRVENLEDFITEAKELIARASPQADLL